MKGLIVLCTTDRSERALLLGMRERGIGLTIIVDPAEQHQEEYVEAGIEVHVFEIKHRFDRKAMQFVKSIADEQSFDFAYCPTSKGLSVTLQALGKQSIAICGYRGTLGNLSYFDPASLRAHLHPRVDCIICVCEAVKRFLHGMGIPNERLSAVYKGHNPAWYQQQVTKSRTEEGLKDDAFVIGCLANFRPLKGIDVLLHAVSGMAMREQVQLFLIGEMRDKSIPLLIESLGLSDAVVCTGFRKDAASLLSLCNITVMPSVRREGLARAVIESLALGIPAMVSDVGGLPETVEHGVSGWVVPASDVPAWSSALDTAVGLSSDAYQRMSEQAAARVPEVFGIDRYVETMLASFTSAVARVGEERGGYLSQLTAMVQHRMDPA